MHFVLWALGGGCSKPSRLLPKGDANVRIYLYLCYVSAHLLTFFNYDFLHIKQLQNAAARVMLSRKSAKTEKRPPKKPLFELNGCRIATVTACCRSSNRLFVCRPKQWRPGRLGLKFGVLHCQLSSTYRLPHPRLQNGNSQIDSTISAGRRCCLTELQLHLMGYHKNLYPTARTSL